MKYQIVCPKCKREVGKLFNDGCYDCLPGDLSPTTDELIKQAVKAERHRIADCFDRRIKGIQDGTFLPKHGFINHQTYQDTQFLKYWAAYIRALDEATPEALDQLCLNIMQGKF